MNSILAPGIHWLSIFFPVSLLFEAFHAPAPYVFFSAALAIIPIAKLISSATESLAKYTGDSVGGLLNATFGNLPELIIATIALREGMHQLVLASLAGAILANLLLALGVAFLVGGLKHHVQEYNVTSIRVYSSMMMIAVLSLMVPSAFSRFLSSTEAVSNENALNVSLAVVLLIGYVLYLVFMLKTHPDFFRAHSNSDGEEHEAPWSLKKSTSCLIGASLLAAYMSEVLVGSVEDTGHVMGLSSSFIGVILVAIVGGAAESLSAILVASKNKMDLSIGIALGSSIQIALFVAPVLVLLSFFIGPSPLILSFNRALIGTLFFAVLLGSMISGDGQSHWYKGVQLILVYVIFAMLFYFLPG